VYIVSGLAGKGNLDWIGARVSWAENFCLLQDFCLQHPYMSYVL